MQTRRTCCLLLRCTAKPGHFRGPSYEAEPLRRARGTKKAVFSRSNCMLRSLYDDLIFASTTGLVLKVARRDLAQVLLRHLGCQSRFSQHPQAWAAHWEVLWTPVALTNTVQPCASPLSMKLHASPEIWVRQWITRCEAMRKCGVHSVSLLLAPIRR